LKTVTCSYFDIFFKTVAFVVFQQTVN